MELSSHIFPLGDAALTLDLGNRIDPELNKKAVAIGAWMNKRAFAGVKDIIVAYSSVSVFYDVYRVKASEPRWAGEIYHLMRQRLEEAMAEAPTAEMLLPDNPVIRIPVCYEAAYAPDLDALAASSGLSPAEVIGRHTRTHYRVYMIGFLPGFPYMGKVDPAIATSRKDRPVAVAGGSVGIAGDQTGIYPFNSPGGWQIIGRTPLQMFDAAAPVPVALSPGDTVEFYAIGQEEFLRSSRIVSH